MDVLDHSRISMTMNVYAHLMPSLLQDTADAVGGALWNDEDSQST
ncbi:MAG: hypothetical protein ACQSGP_25320 [Frankia sp.]